MAVFAVLTPEDVVYNRIVADSVEVAETLTGAKCVECDGFSDFGKIWNGTTFINPPATEEEPTE
jgi:hypothetical protein